MSFFRKIKTSSHINNLFSKKAIDLMGHDAHKRQLVIYHIDPETEGTFNLTVHNEDSGEQVIERVCAHYNLHEYKEYFGLKYTLVDEHGDHEIFWLDPVKLVGKQLKNTNNVLTFRVKHFPASPQRIESEYVRYLVFLQLRNYLLRGDLHLSLTEEVRLASYAVQAAIGDYDEEIHAGNYLAELKFLSQKSLKAEQMITELHKQLKGKTPGEMELEFLEKASQFDTYGAEMIRVKNNKDVLINFGVSHNGIITYLYENAFAVNLSSRIEIHPWTQIGKISYEGKLIKITVMKPDDKNSEIFKKHAMIFKCNSSRVCKHLWKFILDQKSFFNFERGTDVPKVKSSSGLFSRKSKFRFTGRCENEVISSQSNDAANTSFGTTTTVYASPLGVRASQMSSLMNDTMNTTTMDTTSMDTTMQTNVKYATLPLTTAASHAGADESGQNHVQLRTGGGPRNANVFKRRTFIYTSTLKSLHAAKSKETNLNTTTRSDTIDTDDTKLNTTIDNSLALTVDSTNTSKLNSSSTGRMESILFDIETKEVKGKTPSSMDRRSSSSTHRLEMPNADSDHNNNSTATLNSETKASSLKTAGSKSSLMNGSLTKNSQLLNEAVADPAITPGTVLVADFLKERLDDENVSMTSAANNFLDRTGGGQRNKSYFPKLKSVYLSTIDYVQSKTADKFIFFTFLFIIIAFILIWFVNKQCLFFGWSETSRVCQATSQLSSALSLGKHSSRSSAQRWPAGSQLTSSSQFATTSNNTSTAASSRGRQSVLDPLFNWFFSHYQE